VEDLVNRHIERNDGGSYLTLPPAMAAKVTTAVSKKLQKLLDVGAHPVVLCSPQIRASMRKLLLPSIPNIVVMAYNEIVQGTQIESVGMVVIEQ